MHSAMDSEKSCREISLHSILQRFFAMSLISTLMMADAVFVSCKKLTLVSLLLSTQS